MRAISSLTVKPGKICEDWPAAIGMVFAPMRFSAAAAGGDEDALILDTPSGSIVIVGCAHPGIVAMLQRIAETTKKPIHMVIGGFHLLQTAPDQVRKIVADFKSMSIAWTGPTHCTGDEAMKLFREAYGDHFISGGVGTVVNVPGPR